MDLDRNLHHFLTTYKKDFVNKLTKLTSGTVRQRQEFTDPIGESYRNYLLLDAPDVLPPNEDGELYLEKFKEKSKRIGRIYFNTPLQKELIFKNKLKKDVSEYQSNYCDLEKDSVLTLQSTQEQREKKYKLPDDAEVPLTTYLRNFKDLSKISSGCRPSIIKSIDNNLSVHEKCIGDAISEYSANIGTLGQLIIEDDMYGYRRRSTNHQKTSA